MCPAIAILLAFAPVLAQAQDGPGLTGSDSYESPTYGYEVTWSDDWAAVPGSTTSENDRDSLTLDNGSAIRVQVIGVDPETDLEVLLASMVDPIAEAFPDADVSELDPVDDEVATVVEFTIGDQPAIQRIEARLLPSGDAAIGVRISTNPDLYASAVAAAADEVLVNGDPAFTNLSGLSDDSEVDEPSEDEGDDEQEEEDQTGPEHRDPGETSTGDATFDLAAIPFDAAEIDGGTWAVYSGENIDAVDEITQLSADARGMTDDDEIKSLEQSYKEWDWQRNYLLQYVREEDLGEAGYTEVIQVNLDLYGGPAGAQESFAFDSDVESITAFDAVIEPDAETFGEESYSISLSGDADAGEEFQGVAVSFRIGAVTATVVMLDYDGDDAPHYPTSNHSRNCLRSGLKPRLPMVQKPLGSRR